MARLDLLDPATATGARNAIFEKVKGKFGKHPVLMSALANSPATMNSYLTLFENLTSGRFTNQLARKLGLAIGEENGCEYCISLLAAVAKLQKLTDEDIELARKARSSDPKEQALMDFLITVIRHKGDVTDAELQAVKDAGWNDEDITELFGHLILNFLTNYYWKVARTDIDYPILRLFDQSKLKRGTCCVSH